jgi:hypothetical protein
MRARWSGTGRRAQGGGDAQYEICQHCSTLIKRCNCGADYDRVHWVDVGFGSRWCVEAPATGTKPPEQRHQPVADGDGVA